jgi:hypothetical protein
MTLDYRIDVPVSQVEITSLNWPLVSGTSTNCDSSLEVSLGNLSLTVAGSRENWTAALPNTVIPEQEYTVTATGTNPFNSATATLIAPIEGVPPTVTITTATSGGISGTSTNCGTLTVTDGEISLVVTGLATWSIADLNLSVGTHTITATGTNPFGTAIDTASITVSEATPRVRVLRVLLEGANFTGLVNLELLDHMPVPGFFGMNIFGDPIESDLDLILPGFITGNTNYTYWQYYHTIRNYFAAANGDMLVTERLDNHPDDYAWVGWTRGYRTDSSQYWIATVQDMGIHPLPITDGEIEALPPLKTYQLDTRTGIQPT